MPELFLGKSQPSHGNFIVGTLCSVEKDILWPPSWTQEPELVLVSPRNPCSRYATAVQKNRDFARAVEC